MRVPGVVKTTNRTASVLAGVFDQLIDRSVLNQLIGLFVNWKLL